MTFAIIKTGGKQYLAKKGAKLKVEKLADKDGQPLKEGSKLDFDQVFLVDDGKETKVGAPTVADAKVSGKVLAQARKPKVTVLRYRNKTNSRAFGKYGHKQPYTEVEITEVK
ncbi:MAG: 50S ribosomal protein L21 [Patescibacteria group bacterium]|nr:50S ribosomal protein L21 [Patescibacteria group bacterium]